MSTLNPFFASLQQLAQETAIEQILKYNQYSASYGLVLTRQDAMELVEARAESLAYHDRVEVGSSVLDKLVFAFYDSSYIMKEDYVQVLQDLMDIFYDTKNEAMDLISDDELIQLMKEYFENRCGGSLELLRDRDLCRLAKNLRYGVVDYLNLDALEQEDEDPETNEWDQGWQEGWDY